MKLREVIIPITILLLAIGGLQAQDKPEMLWKAARANDTAAISALLGQGVDVNAGNTYGVTALTFAADKGNLTAVRLLLEHGADPNRKDSFYNETPLGWAIYKRNTPVILAMIDHGGDISNPDMVLGAAGSGLPEVVRRMLDKGAPGAGDVLMQAISIGDSVMFSLALGYTSKNDSILSEALGFATAQKRERFIARLTEAGAKMPPEKPAPAPAKFDETLSGSYSTQDMNKVELVVTDGALTASFDGSPGYALKYENDTSYSLTDIPGFSLTIRRAGGKATAVTLVRPNQSTTYFRVQEKGKAGVQGSAVEEDHARAAKVENWSGFRGNATAGIADGQHPPVTWDGKIGRNLKWKCYIPGLAHASPVVWGDRVFVVTALSSDTASEYRVGLFGDVEPANDTSSHIWKIYCLDRKNGRIRWEKKAYEGIPRVKRHVKGSQANATPVTNGDYVVAVYGSEGMVCYDMSGHEKWRKDPGLLDAGWFFNDDTQWGPASSPVIYGHTVILQCDRSKDSFIAAYDLETGNKVWKTERAEISSWGTPTVCHTKTRDELVTNASRYIRGYNPSTGEELWRLSPNSEITVGSPVFMDSLVFVTAGYPPVFPVYAIKTGGSGDISIADSVERGSFVQWRKKRGGTYMPTPIVYHGYLYTLGNNGLLTCYEAATGTLKYKELIKGGGAFTASPVAADGKIYCTSEETGVYVIRSGPDYEIISVNPVGEICMATPAISDGWMFVRGEHHVFCFGLGK